MDESLFLDKSVSLHCECDDGKQIEDCGECFEKYKDEWSSRGPRCASCYEELLDDQYYRYSVSRPIRCDDCQEERYDGQYPGNDEVRIEVVAYRTEYKVYPKRICCFNLTISDTPVICDLKDKIFQKTSIPASMQMLFRKRKEPMHTIQDNELVVDLAHFEDRKIRDRGREGKKRIRVVRLHLALLHNHSPEYKKVYRGNKLDILTNIDIQANQIQTNQIQVNQERQFQERKEECFYLIDFDFASMELKIKLLCKDEEAQDKTRRFQTMMELKNGISERAEILSRDITFLFHSTKIKTTDELSRLFENSDKSTVILSLIYEERLTVSFVPNESSICNQKFKILMKDSDRVADVKNKIQGKLGY
eukprot:TCONS_00005818-protein